MSLHGSRESHSAPALIHKLACKLTGLNGDAVTPYYKLAMDILYSGIASSNETDEIEMVEKVKKSLVHNNRNDEAIAFSQLYRKLLSNNILKNRLAILNLFSCLSNNGKKRTFQGNLPLSSNTVDNAPSQGSALRNGQGAQMTPSLGAISNKIGGKQVASLMSYFQHSGLINDRLPPKDLDICNNRKQNKDNFTNEIPESVLLREIVYAFQGIEGKIIHMSNGKDEIWLDPKTGIPRPSRSILLKLCELGWLYNKIHKHCEASSSDKTLGLVGQSFAAALQRELIEYYRLLGVLEAQLQQEDEQGISPGNGRLTLRRLIVWTTEPMFRLKILSCLIDVCKGFKGGALASVIHSYMINGSPFTRGIVEVILAQVSVPIYANLRLWIMDGDLNDSFNEFFVAADPSVKDNKLWHDKYSMRRSMVPSFLTMAQAHKILSTGKSINFLRQVCGDRTAMRGKDAIQSALAITKVESLFLRDEDDDLRKAIDVAYKETSSHVLSIMHTNYKFMDHLKAMRRYLLLGQGDFIRHLMDLLESHLNQLASSLLLHNLSGILETAIRATNAQFDDPEILRRLDIRILEVSPGDTGWDVFTLDYHMDGPIGTVFTPKVMIIYLRLFNSLWRAKRMEYVLSIMWKNQMDISRQVKSMPELDTILHQCHALTSEMVHFVQQMQYYITFEVMECSWDVLEKKVESAEDLDQIVMAHDEFLDSIMTRSLLDDSSVELLNQLRAIYDLIIRFQNIQDGFTRAAKKELKLRQESLKRIQQNTDNAQWGTGQSELQIEKRRQLEFIKNDVSSTKAQLRILSTSYQDMVKKFLLMLTSHTDVSLQFLSFRLDFNEHYKNRDSRLHTPLTYQHRRLSSIALDSICQKRSSVSCFRK